jgi:UDP-glucose:(heptosyl)LPS alpha-1,3-glucosyltransferase
MKVGLVRRGYSATGGAEAYLLRLASGLAGTGHEPILVASETWPEQAWPHGPILRLPGSTPSAFAKAFHALGRPFDISLALDRTPGCDVFRAGDGVHAAWLRRRARFEPRWRAWLRRWNPKHGALLALERAVFLSSARIIANSRMVASEILEWYGVGEDRVTVIPNGYSGRLPDVPRAAARQRMQIAPGAFCALFVGSGWERKGLATAIEAVGRLPGEAVLLVAGRGDVRRHAPPHLHSRAHFVGPTSDLGSLFAAADVFVLPTLYDPFSNACLEALAVGLPVLTTTANGFCEVLERGVHGDVHAPGDVEALASALTRWRDTMARQGDEVRAACRSRAAEFSIARNVAATISVLEGAISSGQIGSHG